MNKPDPFNDLARHLRADQRAWDTDAAWSRLRSRMHVQRPNRKPWLIAAMLVVALGLGLLVRSYFTTDTTHLDERREIYSTAIGETRTIRLADGSSVVLAPLSELRVSGFNDKSRNVILAGQAFFNVARDATRPFQVTAQDTKVRVLGTSFNVNAFDRADVRVAVATGRVQVNNTVVAPGQLAIVENGQVTVTVVNVEELTAWRTGQLVFSNTRFSDVAATLERWYDVDIEIPNSGLAEARVSAVFARQRIDEVVQVLAETLDARVTRDGRRITFQPK